MEDVLFEARGALGLITLNRPKALNALTLDMIHAMASRLAEWAGDDSITSVLIRGEGERAFCAGGDIRALYQEGHAGEIFAENFFRDEYRLNRTIFRYPKPYIALIDGIAMGGGVGVSVNGAHRIATDNTLFAMPETGIGMFPDVGGSYFLPRCPGETGMYLGLTGHRLKAADCLYTGIANLKVGEARHGNLLARLAEGENAETVLSDLNESAGPSPLSAHREAIDRCFAGDSIEAILAALEGDGSSWAMETHAALMKKSPFALKVAFRQLRAGRELGFEDCMVMEYRLSQRIAHSYDFREGVRAVVIDKDQNPQWNPPTLAGVRGVDLDAVFAPLGAGDLVF